MVGFAVVRWTSSSVRPLRPKVTLQGVPFARRPLRLVDTCSDSIDSRARQSAWRPYSRTGRRIAPPRKTGRLPSASCRVAATIPHQPCDHVGPHRDDSRFRPEVDTLGGIVFSSAVRERDSDGQGYFYQDQLNLVFLYHNIGCKYFFKTSPGSLNPGVRFIPKKNILLFRKFCCLTIGAVVYFYYIHACFET